MEKIAVCGPGVIGSCFVTLISGNSMPVLVLGRSGESLDRCRKAQEQNWDDLIANGLAAEENKAAAKKLISYTTDPEDLKGISFVFETVAEDTEVKKEIYAKIDKYAGSECIIASGTSSLDAEILAGIVNNPSRLLIAHPFQPAHMLPLVEVVRNKKTSDETVKRTNNLLNALARQVVNLNKSVPGFLVNRFAQALFRESIYLIEQGITTAEDIDRAVKYAVGMRYASIGLLEYYDDVGFGLESTIAGNVYPDLCDTKEIQPLIKQGFEKGLTGLKTGSGLHSWEGKDMDDYRLRKQAPYFPCVKDWNMPR